LVGVLPLFDWRPRKVPFVAHGFQSSCASGSHDEVFTGRSPHLAEGKSETWVRFQFPEKL
jgi:hypothetical protein